MPHDVTLRPPYIHSEKNTQEYFLDNVIACLPITACAILLLGWSAIFTLSICVCSCVAVAYMTCKLGKRPYKTQIYVSLLVALTLALMLPKNVPWWACIVASIIAMVLGLVVWGGVGRNFIHPAVLGCSALLLIPSLLPQPLRHMTGRFILGYDGGALGECGSILTLLGAGYLMYRKAFFYRITIPYLLAAFFTGLCIPNANPLAILLWGGTILGAVIIAADPITSPMEQWQKIIYGFCCGIVSTLLAYYFWGMGGVAVGIFIMNLLGRSSEYIILWCKYYKNKINSN